MGDFFMIDKYGKWILCLILALFVIYFPGKNDNNRQKEGANVVEQVEESGNNEEKHRDGIKVNCDFKLEDLDKKLDSEQSDQMTKKENVEAIEIDKETLKKIDHDIKYQDRVKDVNNSTSKIKMDRPMDYSDIKGVTCFRGNNFRSSASYGFVDIKEKKLEIVWDVPIGAIGRWTGVGWNGQPAIVEWSEEARGIMNIFDEKKKKENLKEVIYGTLDSNIYFLDLEDGSYTRDKIKISGPIKGSVTIDPRGVPLLYVGQGINYVDEMQVKMGYRIFNLIDQSLLHFIDGRDSFALRGWSAFDSNSIIDKNADIMFICGENGIVYKMRLNTQYDESQKELSIDPENTKYRYKVENNRYQGIENSIAVYKNLGYFADNGGWLQCLDLNTLEPVWIYNVTDDTDSTIVIDEEENEKIVLYTACEVDKQGEEGLSYIRKMDALTGQLIWEKSYSCYSKHGERPNNGGALATPVVGKASIQNLVIYNLARHGGFNKGALIALDKETSEEVWKLELENYSWSSPVDIYTEDGEAFIILCDSAGKMYLIEGTTGKVLDEISLGSNVEGSPAVYENMAVVGTRGQKIFGIRIK